MMKNFCDITMNVIIHSD